MNDRPFPVAHDPAFLFGCGRFRMEAHLLETCAEEILRFGRHPLLFTVNVREQVENSLQGLGRVRHYTCNSPFSCAGPHGAGGTRFRARPRRESGQGARRIARLRIQKVRRIPIGFAPMRMASTSSSPSSAVESSMYRRSHEPVGGA